MSENRYTPCIILPGIGQSKVELLDKKGEKIKMAWPLDVNGDELMMSRDLLPLWLLVNKPEMLLSSQRGKTNGEGENS